MQALNVPAAKPHAPSVLIVDDDASSLWLLASILDGEVHVVFACNGEDALLRAHEQPPDLVLMDASMPGLGGFEACRRLRADPRCADVPVIFVTAHTDVDTETRALEMGAVDFIHKPVNPPVVRARVRTHLALKQKTDALRRLSVVDALTGIANRRAFDEALSMEWRRAMRHDHPLSLLLVDVDHFKRYNDLHGHLAGDECLRRVAGFIASATQRAGDLAARYGGEEFAVVLPHQSAQESLGFAWRLCEGLHGLGLPHGDSPACPCVTVSIGVATLSRPCDNHALGAAQRRCKDCHRFDRCRAAPRALVELADQALYRAKHEGRNRVACAEGLTVLDVELAASGRGAGAGAAPYSAMR